MSGVRIAAVSPSSPAASADLQIGDELISVNGRSPSDIIEYQQLIDGSNVVLVIQREGESLNRKVTITKDEGAPLGVSIDSAVFDRIRTCDNHCTFCFIYQLPKGLRRSLYVKDDDFRLSFLYGNYTTLTRFTEFDLERVIEEKLSPLYVSIHTTNPSLRASMLRNGRGATSLRWLRALLDNDIDVHAQVVVCPGVNDGDELERTLSDALTIYQSLKSVAVVPLGLSDFSNEPTMRSHTKEEAAHTLEIVYRMQALARKTLGRTMIYASDEYYLLAGLRPPDESAYESLDEAENGIGMIAAFSKSFREKSDMGTLGSGFFQSVDGAPALEYRAHRAAAGSVSSGQQLVVLTGEYAAPILRSIFDECDFEGVAVHEVKNRFFGGNIKVAGLMSGEDLRNAVAQYGDETVLLLPDVCLNEERFIDGLTLADLPRSVTVVPTTGVALRGAVEAFFEKVDQ
jgi:putative radical SAM enzyme (TIGR03279 family)